MPTRATVAARIEDARWMADTGESLDGAARRLGMTREALWAFLRRNDKDCLATLLAHQPRDHNRYFEPGLNICDLTGLTERRRHHKPRQRRKRTAA